MKLSTDFFARSPEEVAPDLIGRRMFRRLGRDLYQVRIAETGAYRGTARRSGEGVLYAPGIIYVHVGQRGYRTLAIGTEKEGEPSVVTIRHALCLSGFEVPNKVIDGPGKLSNTLQIGMELDGQPINGDGLWIEGEAAVPSLVEYISPDEARMSSNCFGYHRLRI